MLAQPRKEGTDGGVCRNKTSNSESDCSLAGTEAGREGGAVPAGVEEADERGRGVVGDAADPDDGAAGLAALPVLAQAALEDAR